jgi:peptidoglycan/LPS O-acetylase OafA/YrhL
MAKSAIPGASDEDVTFRRACMTKPLLRPYMPELQSIRGLACLAVLFYHGLCWYNPPSATGTEAFLRTWTAGGHRGVNLFFVLSGLLITNILLDSKGRPNYFVHFYKRRALRILPVYWMTLALVTIYGEPRSFLVLSLLHAANLATVLGIDGYGVLWSLAIEEQFYMFWPLIVRKFHARILIFVCVCIFIGSFATKIWFGAHGLAVGALLVMFLRSEAATQARVKGLFIMLTLVGASTWWWSQWARPPLSVILNGAAWDLIFAASLLGAMLVRASRFERITRPRWLLFFGDISYGLYVIHMLVFMSYRRIFHPVAGLRSVLVQFTVCSLVAIALATLSRFTIEAWFLSLKDKPLKVWRKRVSSEGFEELTPVCEVE